jgi:hypothetical protein
MNHVCVLCVLALTPLVLVSIHRFETNLTRSFFLHWIDLCHELSLSIEGNQPIPYELIDRGESSFRGENRCFLRSSDFSLIGFKLGDDLLEIAP